MQGNLMRHMPPRADIIRTDAAAWNLWGVGGWAEFVHFFGHQGIRKSAVMIRGGGKWDRLFRGWCLVPSPIWRRPRETADTTPNTGPDTIRPSSLRHPRHLGALRIGMRLSLLCECGSNLGLGREPRGGDDSRIIDRLEAVG